ncbi:ABC-type transport system involved in multi-copper enzyme maturation, permease component [Arthrobacter alpinus]|uniref:ABC-type transport system involved in multi-copper enzyme maturation, permease component n=1 Tax=Arthrobacter alpinus TaxID=656366 RepID=A0A1H5N8E4_9MICC|nr:ABC transporter permease [Arthrobacter alpinus]SEE97929.1 ABC-type transport system involved in multi-copper enzyme maturation, permease component [Arthrobacter alpinus]
MTLSQYSSGTIAVVAMELRQRLRSRGWYIMLGIWFALIALVTTLTWFSWQAQRRYQSEYGGMGPDMVVQGPGPLIFEAVLAFVLLFGLLVAPALSANAISGDRSAGTLAIMQVTLLRPGQLLWGKFLASWIAALAFLIVSIPFLIFGIAQGGLGAGHILVALLMLSIELGVVCALGVGISALANRPLFSIVVTYLTVAALTFGTLIAFGLGMMLSNGTVKANQTYYKGMEIYQGEGQIDQPEIYPSPPRPTDITDENDEYACYGPLVEQPAPRSERVAWMLSMNPFVVVADSIPYPERNAQDQMYSSTGFFESISQGARYAQAGPEGTYQCANGKVAAQYLDKQAPLWPLGLGLQLLVTAGILILGWRALRTPARKLAKGTRVA